MHTGSLPATGLLLCSGGHMHADDGRRVRRHVDPQRCLRAEHLLAAAAGFLLQQRRWALHGHAGDCVRRHRHLDPVRDLHPQCLPDAAAGAAGRLLRSCRHLCGDNPGRLPRDLDRGSHLSPGPVPSAAWRLLPSERFLRGIAASRVRRHVDGARDLHAGPLRAAARFVLRSARHLRGHVCGRLLRERWNLDDRSHDLRSEPVPAAPERVLCCDRCLHADDASGLCGAGFLAPGVAGLQSERVPAAATGRLLCRGRDLHPDDTGGLRLTGGLAWRSPDL